MNKATRKQLSDLNTKLSNISSAIESLKCDIEDIKGEAESLKDEEQGKFDNAYGNVGGMAEVGDRVFAIRNATETEVFLYGFGVYNGNQKLPKEVGPEGMPNPQILLDNGGVVWGIQCWWGAEAAFEPRYGKHTKVEVSP